MEGYSSIFSSSTNSPSSSSTNFPFSLSHVDYHDNYQDDHHLHGLMMGHHHHHHHQDQRSISEAQVVDQSHTFFNNYHHHHDHQNHQVDDDKGIVLMTANDIDDDNNNKHKVKKGSSDTKKVKKHRYAFQTRSQVDILDDGYRWRKYGQKAVKNNKFPRSYYRCTHQGCNVKKQVQRLSKDEGVVVTTYEGIHSHPIEKSTDNFEHILSQMQIYTAF